MQGATSRIHESYAMIQAHLPEGCQFLRFQQSLSTESRYMRVAFEKDGASSIFLIRVSEHKTATMPYCYDNINIPRCSIVLAKTPHPERTCWVDAVLWLYEQAEQPTPRITRDAIWRHYTSFFPVHYGKCWPKSLVKLNRDCRTKTLERIVQQYPHVGYIQKMLHAAHKINPAAKSLLVEEMSRMLKKFHVAVQEHECGCTFLESALQCKKKPNLAEVEFLDPVVENCN